MFRPRQCRWCLTEPHTRMSSQVVVSVSPTLRRLCRACFRCVDPPPAVAILFRTRTAVAGRSAGIGGALRLRFRPAKKGTRASHVVHRASTWKFNPPGKLVFEFRVLTSATRTDRSRRSESLGPASQRVVLSPSRCFEECANARGDHGKGWVSMLASIERECFRAA